MTFGEGAARLAGVAGAGLRWSPDAFWRATPAELAAVVTAAAAGSGETPPPDAALIAHLQKEHPDG
ncbi:MULTISPECIES: phage tail assembly chaperone [unclassified Sphingomonas]|uniref:phage tail assembly chaperone n=1 Tax=unclassified Sphingomonas TaxID=196159 RepID=UPI000E100F4B|nr:MULTISPECIES: phage tail assembly chaperone [unclassified Sphingomonas]AXJ95486.1 phage tail assembly chaperone [Sphingomonas sp. FARSPH]